MNVQELMDDTVTPDLKAWLLKQETALQALGNIGDLFAHMHGQTILGEVSKDASITGDVYIGKGTKIPASVTIEGFVYIGENVTIRPHVTIRDQTYIADDCVVGHSAEIKHAICLNGSKMQSGVFVGDSVIGCSTRIGSGVIIANRKFNQTEIAIKGKDGTRVPSGRTFFGLLAGQSCRLGANSVTYPGTVIHEHTWVGAGCVLHGSFGPDEMVSLKQDLDIKPKKRVILSS